MNKQFSQRLGRTIDATGLNPTQFARRANIPQGTISKCLNGHVPTARILLRISRLTGKSVDWLLLGKEHKVGIGYVAESPARYGRGGGKKADEEVWIGKLRKVLRGKNRRKAKTVKDILDG
ncbi:MAG TPA: helix-turn-helix domain-containing protein [Candidatus Binatia bacterium]|jgi:transcriptional regulator with XRE-family HTH domain